MAGIIVWHLYTSWTLYMFKLHFVDCGATTWPASVNWISPLTMIRHEISAVPTNKKPAYVIVNQ